MELFVNVNSTNPNSLVKSLAVQTPVNLPELVLGDKRDIKIYFVDGENYADFSGSATHSVKLAIGGSRIPATGSWSLSDDADSISFDYNITPAALQTALGDAWSIKKVTGVAGSYYRIEFNEAPTNFVGDGSELVPESNVVITELTSKTFLVQLRQNAIAYSELTPITDGFSGTLDLLTLGAVQRLSNDVRILDVFEIEVTFPDGRRRTYAQTGVVIKNEVIDTDAAAGTAKPTLITMQEALNMFAEKGGLVAIDVTGSVSPNVVGLYRYDGEFNQEPSYKATTEVGIRYLWYGDGRWKLTDEKGAGTSVGGLWYVGADGAIDDEYTPMTAPSTGNLAASITSIDSVASSFAGEAEISATNSANSEANASASETAAQNFADETEQFWQQAGQSAAAAQASKTSAETSEANASLSETNAADSEIAASISETNAAASATEAANSAALVDIDLETVNSARNASAPRQGVFGLPASRLTNSMPDVATSQLIGVARTFIINFRSINKTDSEVFVGSGTTSSGWAMGFSAVTGAGLFLQISTDGSPNGRWAFGTGDKYQDGEWHVWALTVDWTSNDGSVAPVITSVIDGLPIVPEVRIAWTGTYVANVVDTGLILGGVSNNTLLLKTSSTLGEFLIFNNALPVNTTNGVKGLVNRYFDGVWTTVADQAYRPEEIPTGIALSFGVTDANDLTNITQSSSIITAEAGARTGGDGSFYTRATVNTVSFPVLSRMKLSQVWPVTVKAGARLRFSFYCRVSVGRTIQFRTLNGTTSSTDVLSLQGMVGNLNTWVLLTGELNPLNDFDGVEIGLLTAADDTGATFDVDDLIVTVEGASLNLVPQGLGKQILDVSNSGNNANGTKQLTYTQPANECIHKIEVVNNTGIATNSDLASGNIQPANAYIESITFERTAGTGAFSLGKTIGATDIVASTTAADGRATLATIRKSSNVASIFANVEANTAYKFYIKFSKI